MSWVGSHAATVFRVQNLDPGFTLKRSEFDCASVKKVVVSIVANHNHGCEGKGYSLVTAHVIGEGGKVRNHQIEKFVMGFRRMSSRSSCITNRKTAMQVVKLQKAQTCNNYTFTLPKIMYYGYRKTAGNIKRVLILLYNKHWWCLATK